MRNDRMMLHIHDLYLCGSDLQPYIHTGVFRRDRVFMSARFQCEASPFIGKHCHISGRVKRQCPAVEGMPCGLPHTVPGSSGHNDSVPVPCPGQLPQAVLC